MTLCFKLCVLGMCLAAGAVKKDLIQCNMIFSENKTDRVWWAAKMYGTRELKELDPYYWRVPLWQTGETYGNKNFVDYVRKWYLPKPRENKAETFNERSLK